MEPEVCVGAQLVYSPQTYCHLPPMKKEHSNRSHQFSLYSVPLLPRIFSVIAENGRSIALKEQGGH